MYASQRNSLSPTWHMLLMGLMSLVLFFGGLVTNSGHQDDVLVVDRLPNEGLLRPTAFLPWDTFRETSQSLLVSRYKTIRDVKAVSRLKHPEKRTLGHGVLLFAQTTDRPECVRRERPRPLHEKAFLPHAGWDGPVSFSFHPPPSPSRLTDARIESTGSAAAFIRRNGCLPRRPESERRNAVSLRFFIKSEEGSVEGFTFHTD